MDATARPTWRSHVWIVAASVLAAIWLLLAAVGVDSPRTSLIVGLIAAITAYIVVVWAVLASRRRRREFEESLTEWAAERAAQQERLRIARELHDLASHGLGLITVRAASVSALAGDAAEEERRRALADIEEAGRAATAELRRMLAVLRTPGEEDAPLHPLNRLDDLPAIAESGFGPVELDVGATGSHDDVPAGVQAAICAIAREALANVSRHAGPVPARLELRLERDAVVLTVHDDGPAPGWRPHPGAGHGIAGMHERAEAWGGTLRAERTGGGFTVEARLPYEPGTRPARHSRAEERP